MRRVRAEVDAAFVAVGGVRREVELAGTTLNGDLVPEGGFDEDVLRVVRDLGLVAALDAGETFGGVAVADDAVVLVDVVAAVVKEVHRFALLGPTHRQVVGLNLVEVVEVRRTAEFEHHVVGDVDERRDRALTGALEAFLHPRGRFGAGVDVADDARSEAAAEIGRFDAHGQTAVARGRHGLHFGKRQRRTRHGVQVARDADQGECVAAVRRQLHFDAGVVELGVFADVRAHGRVFGKKPNARVVLGDAEFARRAEHPHRDDAAQLRLLDLEAAREFGADEGAGGLHARLDVRSAADDLQEFARAGVHFADVQMVGILMIAAGDDLRHDDARKGGRHARNLLHFEARHRQGFGERFGGEFGIAILAQPVFGKQHLLNPFSSGYG